MKLITIASITTRPVLVGVIGALIIVSALIAWSANVRTPETAATNGTTVKTHLPVPLTLSNEARTEEPAQNPQAETKVTINGKSIEVPPSGTIHQATRDGSSSTTIDIQVDNGSTSISGTSSTTSMDIEVQSSSTSSPVDRL